MEIVLLENIKDLGKIGDVVNVKRGHGRNFLIRYGKALKASKINIDLVNKKKDKLNEKNITLKKNAKKIYDIINKKKYKFSKMAKDNDELYGSIKPKEISKNIGDRGITWLKYKRISLFVLEVSVQPIVRNHRVVFCTIMHQRAYYIVWQVPPCFFYKFITNIFLTPYQYPYRYYKTIYQDQSFP